MTTQEQMNQSVMGTYGRFPVVIDHGAGESCADETGKQYIDFGSGIGTTSLGYCNEAWTEAVCKQVKTMQHTSNLYYTKVQADFAQKLCQTAGYEKVFFCNSGAEANECAIKLARKYSFDKYGRGRGAAPPCHDGTSRQFFPVLFPVTGQRISEQPLRSRSSPFTGIQPKPYDGEHPRPFHNPFPNHNEAC